MNRFQRESEDGSFGAVVETLEESLGMTGQWLVVEQCGSARQFGREEEKLRQNCRGRPWSK